MKFAKGQSGNASGWPKGKPHKLTATVRKMVNDKGGKIVEGIIQAAEDGDPTARQLFMKYLLPRPKLVTTPVDLPPVDSLIEIRAQIAKLASLAAGGVLDIDSMTAISRTLALAAGLRLEELEDILADREAQAPDDDQR